MSTGKHFFAARIAEDWNRLPPREWDSPTLEILNKHLDTVPSKQLYMALLEKGF